VATQVLDDDTHVEHPGLRSRRWWRWIIAGIAVALVTAWLWIGNHPAVSQGSYTWNGPGIRVANDGVGDTRLVVEEHEAKLILSVRNSGLVPFTLVGPGEDVFSTMSLDTRFGPSHTAADVLENRSRETTLRPGEERGVLLTVRVDQCFVMPQGAHTALPVTLRFRHLCITTTPELPPWEELDGLHFSGDDFQQIHRPSGCP
jgi:hypothetical protein